jgi:hypothetical protein
MAWLAYVWRTFRHDMALTVPVMTAHLAADCPRCLWLIKRLSPPDRLPMIWDICWICKGSGRVFEMEGWAAPAWADCGNCHGTGYLRTLPCGCTMVPPNIIASCYFGHGHVSGQPTCVE